MFVCGLKTMIASVWDRQSFYFFKWRRPNSSAPWHITTTSVYLMTSCHLIWWYVSEVSWGSKILHTMCYLCEITTPTVTKKPTGCRPLNHRRVSIVVADVLARIWYQAICNHHDDVDQSVHQKCPKLKPNRITIIVQLGFRWWPQAITVTQWKLSLWPQWGKRITFGTQFQCKH